MKSSTNLSRRTFVKTAAAIHAAAIAPSFTSVFAAGSETLRIGVIGCGGRGTRDTTNCLKAAKNVELIAMADLFPDRLKPTLNNLKKQFPDKVKVTPETTFYGFDAFEKLLKTDIDLVILTCPPQFRARHLKAAVNAGKHAFVEKPVAVDPVAVRSVIESANLAKTKNLTIVAGTQARRLKHRVEIIKRIHDGAIGELLAGQCFRMGGGMTGWGAQKRSPNCSDMEWQIRRWLFYTWLSGDFIAEMHVHELDIVNWMIGAHPVKCVALGGRLSRTDPKFGNVFDNFSVEYEYPNGVKVAYYGSQIDSTANRCHEKIIGTKGYAYTDWSRSYITGPNAFKYEPASPNPEIAQHADQINAIRNAIPLNEGVRIAESSLTAIMGRMSAYTGKELSWNWAMNASKLDLSPVKYELGPLQTRPVAIPGKTKLI